MQGRCKEHFEMEVKYVSFGYKMDMAGKAGGA